MSRRFIGPWLDAPLMSEIKHEAAKDRSVPKCQTRGCPFKATLDSPWCAQHRKTKPQSIDELDPKIPGRCNWPSKVRKRSRCKQLEGKCSAHPRTEPPL